MFEGSVQMELNEKVTTTNASPRVLTVSMVYKELDAVQCHLFWNGQMHRFMPSDAEQTKSVLFDILHRESRHFVNRQFLENLDGQFLMKEMAQWLKDREFTYFRRISDSEK